MNICDLLGEMIPEMSHSWSFHSDELTLAIRVRSTAPALGNRGSI